MKRALQVVAVLAGLLLVGVGGVYAWANLTAARILGRTIDSHRVDFPIPFPLSEAELAELDTDEDASAVALDRAIERGRHLVEARYVCVECHGRNFGGGVMVDDPMIGRLLGPNLTSGQGSRTLGYSTSDWDRIVRHGLRPDGAPAAMPSEDFRLMSDQELSDIVTYIRSMPPVDATVPSVRLGPLGKVLIATGNLPLSADLIGDHQGTHLGVPPETDESAEFGAHLAGVCTGCHRSDLAGGPVPGGDPSWPPAANITPHEDGIAGWSYDDFAAALLEGRRPDGTELREPMSLMPQYAQNMTETELRALWLFVQSVPAVPTPE